jgi:hypothetical protein
VVGDFNGWDGRVNPMRKLSAAAYGNCFCPGIKKARTTNLKSAPDRRAAAEERSVRVF